MANVGRRRGRGRRHKFELRVINRTLFTVRASRYRRTITYTVTRNMRVEHFSRYYTHPAPCRPVFITVESLVSLRQKHKRNPISISHANDF